MDVYRSPVDPSKITPDAFPMLLGVDDRHRKYLVESIHAIAQGLKDGQIRNLVLQDAKDRLSTVVNEAYGLYVSKVYVYQGKWEQLPTSIHDLESSVNVFGLHSIIACHKKVAATKHSHPMIDVMRKLFDEALPLALAAQELKSKVVKGRQPNPNPKPENPNKIVRTCPCCMRKIAISEKGAGAHMCHHGYERPGTGWQTSSCEGVRFPPLERSSAGLVHILDLIAKQLETTQKALRNLPKREELLDPYKSTPRNPVTIKKGDPFWQRAYDATKSDLRRDIGYLKSDQKKLTELLANWKATETMDGEPIAEAATA